MRMRTLLALMLVVFCSTAFAADRAGSATPASTAIIFPKKASGWTEMPGAAPCFCTDKQGLKRQLGDIICLTIGSRSFQAKCVMSQNVPFWRDQEEGCPAATLPNMFRFAAMTPLPPSAARLALLD